MTSTIDLDVVGATPLPQIARPDHYFRVNGDQRDWYYHSLSFLVPL